MQIDERSLNQLLQPDDHARVIWAYVAQLDLSPLLVRIKAVHGHAGSPPIDPRISLSLWILATTHGVGSARELDRLTATHLSYQWLCGGVSVNYHTLSDFRSLHGEFLDGLLTQTVATLVNEGLVPLHEVAQDGVRVRAHAGANTFRREASLQECLAQAQAQVETLRGQVDDDAGAASRRQQAARERAARERQERIEDALAQRQEWADRQREMIAEKGAKRKEPRASTTDPDARTLRMGDGGTRPAFNIQYATDTDSGIVVAVDVGNVGSDSGQMLPMVEQIDERYEQKPARMLVDGDFATLADIEAVQTQHGIDVYAPVRNAATEQAKGNDPYRPKRNDTRGVATWRVRMGTEEAKAIYKRRASTAEWVNARVRNNGLQQLLVRGLKKVRATALLHALTSNLMPTMLLRARRAAA
ncbi:Mobile element protein [Fimbriiglobus ruber]|uniref:Mobile element protein n=2 Tax=Fimbriiglobus ruber TaxID=1908690 RepID=A0A225DW53_9BACT|nr:Mobile element protein [Fimbriiglobus ruber]